MTREEELRLIARVLGGERDAFEPLVLEHQKKIYNLTYRMTGSSEDAYDLSQEAFLKAYRNLGDFRGDSSFGSWLYRLASNLCIDFLRKEKKRNTLPTEYLDDDGDARSLEVPDTRFEPQTRLEHEALREAIERGLAALSPEHRQILIMREISGMSYEQIGSILEVEEGTVKSRIFRARARLAKYLRADGNFSPSSSSTTKEGG